jgi:hypothetical protein
MNASVSRSPTANSIKRHENSLSAPGSVRGKNDRTMPGVNAAETSDSTAKSGVKVPPLKQPVAAAATLSGPAGSPTSLETSSTSFSNAAKNFGGVVLVDDSFVGVICPELGL